MIAKNQLESNLQVMWGLMIDILMKKYLLETDMASSDTWVHFLANPLFFNRYMDVWSNSCQGTGLWLESCRYVSFCQTFILNHLIRPQMDSAELLKQEIIS